MKETEALDILNIPRSTLKEWSNPTHSKHKLYLLIKHTDAKEAEKKIKQKVPAKVLTLLNRNIKEEERYTHDEIFKLFSKKSYARLTKREKVAFAKLVREINDVTLLCQLFDQKVVTKETFEHLFKASPFKQISTFESFQNLLDSSKVAC